MVDRRPISLGAIIAAIDGTGARIGVADGAPFPDVATEMDRRVASGERGQLRFGYGAIDVATDPGRSFPWARSIVVAAVPYLDAGDGVAGGGAVDEPRRSVARFADGDRYVAVRDVLAMISTTIEASGWRAEAVWDDDRLVDRALAVRSGVAWWGKSTMALAPGLGPWFLIGSVVTDAALSVTPPMERSCGTCVACIPACPTGAIVAEGILDARKCLAAVFQSRGVIPMELRKAAGTRVYGCDDCLTSCPPGHRAIAGVPVRPPPDARSILAMSDDQIIDRFDHWYIPGRRARFVRRNALVAIGNDPRPSDLDLLCDHLAHQDALVRIHAAWALGMLGGERARSALIARAAIEKEEDVRAEIDGALRG
jgi:epoxyqueuosine reductase